MNRLTQSISVVIAAYEAQDFIEECLDSILKQRWDLRQIEVLVGVDGCKKTLKKLGEIYMKYEKLSLKVVYFKSNMGCYITSNSLISMAKHNSILTFGADDIMLPDMIRTIMSYSDRYNMIKFKMLNFEHTNRNKCHIYRIAAEGCRFFDKRVFMLVGGYMPWRHTGDSEYIARTKPVTCEAYIEHVLFHRRLHDKALTITPQTAIGSDERNIYKAKIYENYNNGIIQIPMVINKNYKVMFDLKEYWENRYKLGGTSGAGSYGEEAQAKASYINLLIKNLGIESVMEYGCGDSNNLALYSGFKQYTGYDISPYAIELCKTNPNVDHKKCRFVSDYRGIDWNADMALCLDVLFHQVEDTDYWEIMNCMFKANHIYVLLYTSIHVGDKVAAHLKQREVDKDVERAYPAYKLIDKVDAKTHDKKYFLLYKLQ